MLNEEVSFRVELSRVHARKLHIQGRETVKALISARNNSLIVCHNFSLITMVQSTNFSSDVQLTSASTLDKREGKEHSAPETRRYES